MSNYLKAHNIACDIAERRLFSNLSFEARSGEILQVAGPNGIGKTTLLRLLTGVIEPAEGYLQWSNKTVPSYDFYSSLLYLGHTPGVKSSLTALENLTWYFGINGIKASNSPVILPDQNRLLAALNAVDLEGYEDVPCYQMSAGQQRRVALARLYCSEAPLWILDEPFTAIDAKGVAALEIKLQAHLSLGGIVILTSHQPLTIPNVKVVDLSDYCVANLENALVEVAND